MFDSRYFAFATISALLVVSPGATMAVITETVLAEGRLAALGTVLGVALGNSTLALSSALGLSLVFLYWPAALMAIQIGGALYLGYLGVRGLVTALRGRSEASRAGEVVPRRAPGVPLSRRDAIVRGLVTNWLNPSVVLFYGVLLPQFISASDPFFTRFAVLAATHVAMSIVWLSCFTAALGLLVERITRPSVRRSLDGLTGVILIALGVKLLVR